MLNEQGPLLLACNHPNSFLDALILGSYFRQPVHFLARGDAFKNAFAKKILTALKVIPIYRLSEGKEYLALNDTTFERCTEVLMNGGIVLIFSEGLCVNQWKLRPLKKGTARIALNAWKQPEISKAFRVIPVTINYSSFTRFRKNLIIDFGTPINRADIASEKTEGEQINELNKLLYQRLENGLLAAEKDINSLQFLLSNLWLFKRDGKEIIEILKQKQNVFKSKFEEDFVRLSGTKKVALKPINRFIAILFIPLLFVSAVIGLLIHLPFYFPVNSFIKKKTEGTVFYHSAMFGVLIIFYPVYVLMISMVLLMIYNNLIFLWCLLIMPFLGLLFLFWKDCVEGVMNFYRLSETAAKDIELLRRPAIK